MIPVLPSIALSWMSWILQPKLCAKTTFYGFPRNFASTSPAKTASQVSESTPNGHMADFRALCVSVDFSRVGVAATTVRIAHISNGLLDDACSEELVGGTRLHGTPPSHGDREVQFETAMLSIGVPGS